MEFRRRVKYFLIRKATKWLMSGILKTCRIHLRGEHFVREAEERGTPIIHTLWHRHIFVGIYLYKNSGAHPLISHSDDGELVSQVVEELGIEPVRGSSSKGGARAFLEMMNLVKNSDAPVVITADGPKGPLREVKSGTVFLAQKAGAVIIPMTWHGSRVKIFEKTWDRFMVPLPFSDITFAYGEPFIPTDSAAPGQTTQDRLEAARADLQERMIVNEREIEAIYSVR